MIGGVVNSLEARIRLTLKGRRGRSKQIEALIDMGYTGWLTLPPEWAAELDLRCVSIGTGTLADGSSCMFRVSRGSVVWDRRPRELDIDEVEGTPLVGMALMEGYELKAQIWEDGKVTLKMRPKRAKR
jgi:clan AA aspartic protease